MNREDGTTVHLSEQEFNCIYEFGKRMKFKEQLMMELQDVKWIKLKDSFIYCSQIQDDPAFMEEILDAKLNEEKMVDPILYTAADLLDKEEQRFPYTMELTISCPHTQMTHTLTIRGNSIISLKSKIIETVKWMCNEGKIVGRYNLETLFAYVENGKLSHVDIDSGWFTFESGNLDIEID